METGRLRLEHNGEQLVLTPAEFAKRYYENKQAEEATQPVEMAGTLSL